MPISFFIGPPRTGKTYEAVMTMVLPALEQGRRVVTNIPLNEEAIREYFRSQRSSPFGRVLEVLRLRKRRHAVDVQPRIVSASLRQLREPESYPWDPEGEFISGSLVEPGDMLVIDEAHVVFPANEKMDSRITSFFRVHGHFFDDVLGKSIDIVVITQDAATLRSEFKYLGETYMKVTPVRSKIGGKHGGYKASYYPGPSLSTTDMIGKPALRRISPAIYACYKSFTHGSGGKTEKMDSRVSAVGLGTKLYLGFGACSILWGLNSYLDPLNLKESHSDIRASSSPAGGPALASASGRARGRCYDAGILIDGRWHSLGADGELVAEAGDPRDGCPAAGHGAAVGLDRYGL